MSFKPTIKTPKLHWLSGKHGLIRLSASQMFHPRKQEVKAFVIFPIHHPETAQAAICLCLGATTAEWSSHISLMWRGSAETYCNHLLPLLS